MEIGAKIRTARSKKGMTQEELGNILGVQKSCIAKYESGKIVNIKRSTLQKIAETLDLNGADLIIDSDPAKTAKLTARVLNDGALMDSLELYYTLNPNDQEIIRGLILSLAKK